jgi:hypothetical protein
MAETINIRPSWVKPGEQWTPGQTSPIPSILGTKEIDTTGSPAITPPLSGITASGAGVTTQGQTTLDDLQKRLDALATQQPNTEIQTEKTSIMDLITKRENTVTTQKSAVDLRKEALAQTYSEMGVTPEQIATIGSLIGQVTSFNKQLADLEVKKQNAVDAIGDRSIPMEEINLEQNATTKKYNSEISAVGVQAAVKVQELQMIQGAYTDAKATASDIVNLATHDQAQEVADIEWSLDAHQDLYNLMTSEEKTQWDKQYTIAKDALDTKKTELSNISKYVVDPSTSDAFKGVDWTKLTETEAMDLVNNYTSSSAYLTRQKKIALAGSVSSGGTETDTSNIDIWANSLMTGQIGIQNVPMNLRDSVLGRINELGGSVISTTFAGKAKEAITAFNTADQMLNKIEQEASNVITAGSALGALWQRVAGNIGAATKLNPNAAVYKDTVNAFLSQLTRASGERGVLTTQDVDRIKNALPAFSDTKAIADRKLQNLRDLFGAIKEGATATYTQPLNKVQSTGENNDPLGIR